jgi:hypothetical protein
VQQRGARRGLPPQEIEGQVRPVEKIGF